MQISYFDKKVQKNALTIFTMEENKTIKISQKLIFD